MKRLFILIMVSIFTFSLTSCSGDKKPSQPTTTNAPEDLESITQSAMNFVSQLKSNEYSLAIGTFDATMKAQVSEQKLKEIWEAFIGQVGSLKEQKGTWYEKVQVYDVVYVTCQFEKGLFDVKVVYNSSRQIAGLFFVPAKKGAVLSQDNSKMPSTIIEKSVTVGSGEWALPATLTLPAKGSSFASVILVHGSGPNDRDETIGPNKLFRDIAWGLAEKGIAVLRYEKRTKQYPEKMAALADKMTVQQETIDDILQAFTLMQSTKELDKNKIYILGHSLGGYLMPRIALQTKDAAGYISLAGSARPLEDLILEQTEYILSIDSTLTKQQKDEQISQLKAQIADIKNVNLSDSTSSSKLLGVPAKYWLDLRGYKPAEMARQITKPMLMLQGERDYQVTLTDFNIWKAELSSKSNVTFKTWPDLNHLFMTGTGKSKPQEYENAGHVADKVIDEIAAWIEKL